MEAQLDASVVFLEGEERQELSYGFQDLVWMA